MPPIRKAIKYQKTLNALIKRMTVETNAAVKALFISEAAAEHFAQDENLPNYSQRVLRNLQDTFQKLFDSVAPKIADDFVNDVDESSEQSMSQLLLGVTAAGVVQGLTNKSKNALNTPASNVLSNRTRVELGFFPNRTLKGKRVEKILNASIAENVSLIKSIPREYLAEMEKTVMRAVTTGKGPSDIYKTAKSQLELSKDFKSHLKNTDEKVNRRAKLIANDQTRKVYTGLTARRMKNVGMDRFRWLHNGGSAKPRPYHLDTLNGNEYSLSDPPVIDPKTGERGLPGQLVNCRCSMIPVISAEDLSEDE